MKNETIVLPLDVDLLPVTPLKAGNLACIYENGTLRYIKQDGIEVVRMIYAAVRDAQWHTALYTIRDEKIEAGNNDFTITYTAHYTLNDIAYQSRVEIKGAANRISFRMQGEALSSFKRNRIGICVLHPLGNSAGEMVTIEQPDGVSYDANFPKTISPHQPLLNIRNMHWKAAGKVDCSLFFEGDIFETEDQRNWTDSSYKTYSTPLSRPIPATVNKGDTVDQQLVLEVPATTSSKTAEQVQPSSERHKFPKIGYAKGASNEPLSDTAIQSLQHVPFDHYRVELRFNRPGWKETWANALHDIKRLATKLELVLFFTEAVKEELSAFMDAAKAGASYIATILPLSATTKRTTETLLKEVYGHLKKLHMGIRVGYGTDGFFADLNRNRPQPQTYDFLSFSLNPQVHLADTRTIIENLEAQRHTLKTIKTFSDKPVHVSPVTFKVRLADQADAKLQAGYDARQHTAFGAWWTLACLAHLGEANQVTLYQVLGPSGILDNETPAAHTPVFDMLKQLKHFDPKWVSADSVTNTITLENDLGDTLVYTLDAGQSTIA